MNILAWYDCHISTGKVEGINNKIKVLKRAAYGFRDERYFELRHCMDAATLYWAQMPGKPPTSRRRNRSSSRTDRLLLDGETNYRSSLSPFGLKMSDRISGKPLHVDISDLPMKRGITTNRNKFVLGGSGSGKSFFMNHLVRQYYVSGHAHRAGGHRKLV